MKNILLSLFWVCSFSATAQTITHLYDPLNRLAQVAYPDGTTIAYEYDKLGNRTGQTVTAGQVCTGSALTLTGTDFSGTYFSQGQMTVTNADVKVADFVSDTGILIISNFEVELGCDFDAYIQDCSNLMPSPSGQMKGTDVGKKEEKEE